MTGKLHKHILYSSIILLFQTCCYAQAYPLAKKITIHIQNQSVENVLASISRSADVVFSYNSDIIPLDSFVTIRYENTEIQKILNNLFPNRYTYKTSGKYIIIQNKKVISKENKQTELQVKGRIMDSETGDALANTSVYSISGKEEILTDSSGGFTLTVRPGDEDLFIAVNNEHFEDTLLLIPSAHSDSLVIRLRPKTLLDSIRQNLKQLDIGKPFKKLGISSLFVRKDMMTHARNIDYFTQRPVQISFLPFAGTNYRLSGSVSNIFSLNIISGYSYGVNGCEIGGVLNINRGFVRGFQAGGFGNITGGKTKAVQAAGFFNQNMGSVSGVQFAGFYNMTTDTLKGMQASGFANVAGDTSAGAQFAGFANVGVKTFSGIQIAGFANIASHDIKGLQISGFTNVTGKTLQGIQIAGFLNYAKKVEGSQIGLINIADSVSGLSFGVFNLILNGLHQFSIHFSETGCSSLRLSLGTHHFYSVYGIHLMPVQGSLVPGYEYGFGTYLFHKSKLNLSIDAGATYFPTNKMQNFDDFLISKISADLNVKISHHLAIFAGPTYSVHISEDKSTDPATIPDNLIFNVNMRKEYGHYMSTGWFGLQAGLKLAF